MARGWFKQPRKHADAARLGHRRKGSSSQRSDRPIPLRQRVKKQTFSEIVKTAPKKKLDESIMYHILRFPMDTDIADVGWENPKEKEKAIAHLRMIGTPEAKKLIAIIRDREMKHKNLMRGLEEDLAKILREDFPKNIKKEITDKAKEIRVKRSVVTGRISLNNAIDLSNLIIDAREYAEREGIKLRSRDIDLIRNRQINKLRLVREMSREEKERLSRVAIELSIAQR